MFTLSSYLVDALGSVTLQEAAADELELYERRGDRRQTLDGGCYMNDLGISDSDRIFLFTVKKATLEQCDILKRLLYSYSRHCVSTKVGFFDGLFKKLNIGVNVQITFYISSRGD